MIVTDHDLDIAARTVWGEARGESWSGKLAVAWVLKNRAEDSRKRYGQGLAGVCQKPWQFSCWNENDPNRAKLLSIGGTNVVFQECMAAALWAIVGTEPDPSKGAMHYQVIGTNAPWSHGKTPIVTIGHHQFYVGIDG